MYSACFTRACTVCAHQGQLGFYLLGRWPGEVNRLLGMDGQHDTLQANLPA